MTSIQALREKRAARGKALAELVAPDRPWNEAADQPVYDAGLAEIDEIDAQIKRIEKVNDRVMARVVNETLANAAERHGQDNNSPGHVLYAKWLRGGDKALSAEDWQTIRATMSTTTGSEGGFTVATEVATRVIDALKAYGGMRAVANVIRTAQGNPMSFPTSNGVSEEGEIVAENATASDLDVSFGTLSLPVYKYSSKTVAVPWELLQDSSVDIAAFVEGRLVTRLGRVTNKHFTIGTGTGQPEGIMVAAGIGVTAANATSQVTTITYDSLIDLIHSVDPAYRVNGRARFMMNDLSVRQVRKIKDTSGRPIFVPGYEVTVPGGAPDMLCGHAIVVNQDVAVMAASARSIAFGDFSAYTIRDAMDIQMLRFDDSAFAKKGQRGFLAFLRAGGKLLDVGGAVKVFVNAAS